MARKSRGRTLSDMPRLLGRGRPGAAPKVREAQRKLRALQRGYSKSLKKKPNTRALRALKRAYVRAVHAVLWRFALEQAQPRGRRR